MKRRVHWVTMAAACLALATSTGVALAGNPHGTPPGQQKQQATTSSASTSSSSSSSAQTQAAPNPQSKYAGCSGSTSQGAGVKPNNTTKHSTCATADSKQTKLYGNGKTAGGIAMSRGAPGSTMIYGPGNSQPHKVATCPDKHGKVHYKDVHAVKSYPANGCNASTSSRQHTQQTLSETQQTHAATQQSAAATAGVTASSQAASSPSATSAQSGVLGARTTLKAPARAAAPRSGVLGATARTGTLPFTGLPLWIPALAAFGLLGAGLALRHRAGSPL